MRYDRIEMMRGNIWDFKKISQIQKEIAFKFLLEFSFFGKEEPLEIERMEESLQLFSETMIFKKSLKFEIFYKFQLRGKEAMAIKSAYDNRSINVTNKILDGEIKKEGDDFIIDNEPIIYLDVSARSMNHLYREKMLTSFIVTLRKFTEEIGREFKKDIFFHNPFRGGLLSLDEEGNFEKTTIGLFYPNTIRFKRKFIKEGQTYIPVKVKEIYKAKL